MRTCRRDRDIIPAAVTVLAIALFALHAAMYGRYIADDAGISFAYAKNLARGNGLVLNPGTDPVEGYSNFAWTLLVLPFCARGTDPTVGIKALSGVIAVLTLIELVFIGRRLVGNSRTSAQPWLSGFAAVGLAGLAPYTVWATAGLENGFYCLTFTTAILFYLDEAFVACAAALVVLSLTRVEGTGIAALFAVHRAGVLLVARRRPSRHELMACAMFVVPYLAYMAWHWWYFRALVPNSYLAKSATLRSGTLANLFAAVADGWTYAVAQLIRPYRLFAVAPLVGVGLLALRPSMASFFALLLSGAFGLVLLTGGDFYPEFRLGTLVLPLWCLLVVEGARVVVSRIPVRWVAAVLVMTPLALMCEPSIAVASGWGPGPISMGGLKPITADRFVALAARQRGRPITIVDSDIGNVAYFTDFAIVDLGGLANLEIARNGFAPAEFQHYVFEEMKPDVIHLRGIFGTNTNIPLPLIDRDYRQLEGGRDAPYATGWWVRRDSADARDSPFPSTQSGAAEVYAWVKRECDRQSPACHADDALSRRALARADTLRRDGSFAFAFEWYAAAWEADRRNVVALRGREDMRMPGLQGCANAPAAPAHLSASISGSTVTLQWDEVPGAANGYIVEAQAGRGQKSGITSERNTLTVHDVAKQTYTVRVRARNACGAGYASEQIVVTVR